MTEPQALRKVPLSLLYRFTCPDCGSQAITETPPAWNRARNQAGRVDTPNGAFCVVPTFVACPNCCARFKTVAPGEPF